MNLKITDPEYIERFNHFAFDEVVNADESLDTKTRYMAILATLIGCQGTDAYREMLGKALDDKVSPIVIKEVVYQATDYLGYGRTLNFLNITNEVFNERNIEIAKNLLSQNVDMDIIMKATGLTKEEIEKL